MNEGTHHKSVDIHDSGHEHDGQSEEIKETSNNDNFEQYANAINHLHNEITTLSSLLPSTSTSSPSSPPCLVSPYVLSQNDKLSKILNSIKVLVIHRRHHCTSTNHILLIKKIFPMLIQILGCENVQLFNFVKEMIAIIIGRQRNDTIDEDDNDNDNDDNDIIDEDDNDNDDDDCSNQNSSTTNIRNQSKCHDNKIKEMLLRILPFAIPHDLDPLIENEVIELLEKSIFPRHHHIKSNGRNKHIHTRHYHHDATVKNPTTYHIASLQLSLHILEQHQFNNKTLVLNIISNKYLPLLANDNSAHQSGLKRDLIKECCTVIFLYFRLMGKRVNGTNKLATSTTSTTTSQKNHNHGTTHDCSSSSNEQHIIIEALEAIKQYVPYSYKLNNTEIKTNQDDNNHSSDDDLNSDVSYDDDDNFHNSIEQDVARELIPCLVECPILANGYKSLIQKHYDNKEKNMKTKNKQNFENHWRLMDVYALIILFHSYPQYRNDMVNFIQNICLQYSFPFDFICENIIQNDRKKFIALLDGDGDSDYSRCQSNSSILGSALVSLSLHLFLLPIRMSNYPRNINQIFDTTFRRTNKDSENNHPQHASMHRQEEHQEKKQSYLKHTTPRTMDQTELFVSQLYHVLSSRDQKDLIDSLFQLSSHSSFIPTLVQQSSCALKSNVKNQDSSNKTTKDNETKKRKCLHDGMNLPYYLERYIASKSNNKPQIHAIRNVFDVSICALKTLQRICKDILSFQTKNFETISSICKKIIERMSSFATLSRWDGPSMISDCIHQHLDAIEKHEIEMYNCDMFDICSSILVLLSSNDTNNEEQQLTYKQVMMEMLGTLLGGSTLASNSYVPLIAREENRNQIITMGLILGKNVIQSPILNQTERDGILQSVVEILLPRMPRGSQSVDHKFDPVIGYWGLDFLCSLCLDTERHSSNGEVSEKFGAYSAIHIFKHVKTLIARSRLVQLETTITKKHDQISDNSPSTDDEITLLAYRSQPSCFDLPCEYSVNSGKRKMVFCISSFLENISLESVQTQNKGVRTIHWTRYIHSLLDIYLTIGRLVSQKWSPDAWISASLEVTLPKHHCSTNFTVELFSDNSEMDRVIQYPLRKPSFYNGKLDLRSALTYTLSIAILRAVMTNTHEHYSETSIDKAGIRDVHLQSMQYMLAKIYDLRRRCFETLEHFSFTVEDHDLSGEESEARYCYEDDLNTNLSTEAKIDASSVIIVEDLNVIFSHIFEDNLLIPVSTLWMCLKGISVDNCINNWKSSMLGVEHHNNKSNAYLAGNEEKGHVLVHKISFYTLIMKDLMAAAYLTLSEVDQMNYLLCEEVCESILKKLERLSFLDERGVILKNVMSFMTTLRGIKQHNGRDHTSALSFSTQPTSMISHCMRCFIFTYFDFTQYVLEVVTCLESTPVLSSTICYLGASPSSIKELCSEVTKMSLAIKDPLLLCKSLDFVSLFCTRTERIREILSVANWKQLMNVQQFVLSSDSTQHKNVTNNVTAKMPYSCAQYLNQILESLDSDCVADSNKKVSILKLLEVISTSSSECENEHNLRFHLLCHWGNQNRSGIPGPFFQEYDSLIDTFQTILDQIVCDLRHEIDPCHPDMPSVNDFELSSVPDTRRDIRSIRMAYELIFNLFVTSFILSLPVNYNSKHLQDGRMLLHEFDSTNHEFSHFLKMIGSLINTYILYSRLFNDRTLSSMVRSCHIMLTSLENEINNCWKQGRLNAVESKLQSKGRANLRLFKPLSDDMKCLIECVRALCRSISDSSGEEIAETCNSNRKLILSLLSRCEGIVSSLCDVDGTYNYFVPSSLECLNPLKKPKIRNTAKQKDMGKRGQTQKRKRIPSGENIGNENNEEIQDDESDSFGAMGDWGEDVSWK